MHIREKQKEDVFFLPRIFCYITFSRIMLISVMFYTCGLLFFGVETLYAQLANDQQDSTIVSNDINKKEKNQNTTTINENDFKLPKINDSIASEQGQVLSPISIWDTLRVFLVLIIVVAVVYLFLQLLKKFQRKSLTNPDVIDVLSNKTLVGGTSIQLVKVGTSLFLLGTSSQNITLIKEIQKKEEIDEINLVISHVEGHNSSFSEKIQEMFSPTKRKNKRNATGKQEPSVNNLFKRIQNIFEKPHVKDGESNV